MGGPNFGNVGGAKGFAKGVYFKPGICLATFERSKYVESRNPETVGSNFLFLEFLIQQCNIEGEDRGSTRSVCLKMGSMYWEADLRRVLVAYGQIANQPEDWLDYENDAEAAVVAAKVEAVMADDAEKMQGLVFGVETTTHPKKHEGTFERNNFFDPRTRPGIFGGAPAAAAPAGLSVGL